jgi:hypothetical protein
MFVKYFIAFIAHSRLKSGDKRGYMAHISLGVSTALQQQLHFNSVLESLICRWGISIYSNM